MDFNGDFMDFNGILMVISLGIHWDLMRFLGTSRGCFMGIDSPVKWHNRHVASYHVSSET